jgi:hypothetical protein
MLISCMLLYVFAARRVPRVQAQSLAEALALYKHAARPPFPQQPNIDSAVFMRVFSQNVLKTRMEPAYSSLIRGIFVCAVNAYDGGLVNPQGVWVMSCQRFVRALALLCFSGFAGLAHTAPRAESAIESLANRYYEENLALNPIAGTFAGDARFHDQLPQVSAAPNNCNCMHARCAPRSR